MHPGPRPAGQHEELPLADHLGRGGHHRQPPVRSLRGGGCRRHRDEAVRQARSTFVVRPRPPRYHLAEPPTHPAARYHQSVEPAVSKRIRSLQGLVVPLFQFFGRIEARRAEMGGDFSDFVAGNPQEMASGPYVGALQRWSKPLSPDWFAYRESTPEAQAAAAASLRKRLGIPFEPSDICLTNAAIAALAVAIRTVADEGDEVVILRPPHFLYEPLIMAAGARAVRVDVDPRTFDLDVDAIARALTPRTRAVIVNTPHNPTGKVFPPETLKRLASVLEDASGGRSVYLLSDEAYNRLVFNGRPFTSPAAYYPNTMLIYSYGKQLLAPSERIGYIALAPTMPGREEIRTAIMTAQLATGYAFPN